MKTLLGLVLTVVLAGQFPCGTAGRTEHGRHRSLWNESRITDYRMTVDLQKPGHATPMGKFIVTVRGGKIESIRSVNKPDVELSGGKSTLKFGPYVTIDEVFGFIERMESENSSWNKREIEYDPRLGYPKKVNLDAAGVMDEELLFHVLEFETLR